MAGRHKLAVEVLEESDLLVLANKYIAAIKETLEEQKSPYQDGACRIIAFQIALAGNGDSPFREYYEQVADYCYKRMSLDDLGLTGKVYDLVEPELPKAA